MFYSHSVQLSRSWLNESALLISGMSGFLGSLLSYEMGLACVGSEPVAGIEVLTSCIVFVTENPRSIISHTLPPKLTTNKV